jgi:hypothetical protein
MIAEIALLHNSGIMRKRLLPLALLFILPSLGAYSQHDHHHNTKDTVPAKDTTHDHHKMMEHNTMKDHGAHRQMPPMSHAFSLNLPMTRNGSGTGWLPDASPMFGYMMHSKKWMYMAHGSAFLRYNNQDFSNKGIRGGDKVDAPNWFMFMGQRQVDKKGLFHFSSMFSLDELVAGGSGYPLLFQTGESFKGEPLIDRQHPHDFISELSVSYSHAISKNVDVFAYLGYPGEPALGPVTFMHRPSSLDNPNAPISHHWVDATHITFGVATLGIRAGKFKLEGSSFTGREPDEDRYNFDKARFDSWSARLSMNPTRNWALQVSHGFVKSPEELHADEDVNKTTASVIYNSEVKNKNYFSSTVLWGLNKVKDHKGENAALAEAAWHINRHALYGRYEYTQKSSEELVLDEDEYGHHSLFDVHALTVGYNYDLLYFKNTRLAAGANFSIHEAHSRLDDLYGNKPLAFQVYLRVYPELMRTN